MLVTATDMTSALTDVVRGDCLNYYQRYFTMRMPTRLNQSRQNEWVTDNRIRSTTASATTQGVARHRHCFSFIFHFLLRVVWRWWADQLCLQIKGSGWNKRANLFDKSGLWKIQKSLGGQIMMTKSLYVSRIQFLFAYVIILIQTLYL